MSRQSDMFNTLCKILEQQAIQDPSPGEAPMLREIGAEIEALALRMIEAASERDLEDWVGHASKTQSMTLMSAFPRRSPKSIESNLLCHDPRAWRASTDYIRLCVSRGINLDDQFPDLLDRATKGGETEIADLLLSEASWADVGLDIILNMAPKKLKKHADFFGSYILFATAARPEAGEQALVNTLQRRHPGAQVLLLLSAGVQMRRRAAQPHLLNRFGSNHERLELFQYGDDLPAICRDIELQQDARDIFDQTRHAV